MVGYVTYPCAVHQKGRVMVVPDRVGKYTRRVGRYARGISTIPPYMGRMGKYTSRVKEGITLVGYGCSLLY